MPVTASQAFWTTLRWSPFLDASGPGVVVVVVPDDGGGSTAYASSPGLTRLYCSRAIRSISASLWSFFACASRSAFCSPRTWSCFSACEIDERCARYVRVGNTAANRIPTSTTDTSSGHAARRNLTRSDDRSGRRGAHPTMPMVHSQARSPCQRPPTEVARGVAEVVLDAQQLVVLRDAIGSGRRAGLDLAAVGGDREVGDRRVLALARAVRHHRRVRRAGGE